MLEKYFNFLSYSSFAFSIFPIGISIFYLFKRYKFDFSLAVVSSVEFLSGLSNITLEFCGLGHIKLQFVIYDTSISLIWLILFLKSIKNRCLSRLMTLFVVLNFFLFFLNKNPDFLQFNALILQFLYGVQFFWHFNLKSNNNNVESYKIFAFTGFILYSITALNLLIFNNVLAEITSSLFQMIWTTHQFAAIIYFSLLSISIWKSQRI
jgi:hypothetical protein